MKNLYGLIGEKLNHSISPEIHSLIFQKLNIKGVYNLFPVKEEDLKTAINGMKVLGFRGVNVTIPYKIKCMKYLDHVSKESRDIGAVNTIFFKDNTTIGYNTDYYGFGMMMDRNNVNIKGKSCVVLGTGGAAVTIAQYLQDKCASNIVMVTRDKSTVDNKLRKYDILDYSDLNTLKEKDLIINCTPCGMYPEVNNMPVDESIINKFNTAVDLIYNPKNSLFLQKAEELGMKSINGLYMLVAQAVFAEEIWNDLKISKDCIEEIYDYLSNFFR